MIFDYINGYAWLLLLLATPLLRTQWWLDVFVLPAYIYAITLIHFPFTRTYPTIALQVSAEAGVRLFLAYLLVFVALMRSRLSSQSIDKILGRAGVIAIALSILATTFNECMELVKYVATTYKLQMPDWVWNYSGRFISGLIPNKAMNAIFCAALFPFMLVVVKKHWQRTLLLISMIIVAATCNSSSGMIATVVMMATIGITVLDKTKEKLLAALVVAAPLLIYAGNSKTFWNGTGRFPMYKLFLSIMSRWDYIIGKGPGTFFSYGVYIQGAAKEIANGFYLYFHSDPLQLFFEYGAVGCVLLLFVLYYTLKFADALTRPALLALLSGSLFYYPAHFPTHIALYFLLIKLSVNNYEDQH